MITSAPPAPRQRPNHPAPVLRVTFYDRVSSFMMATVLGLLLTVLAIIAFVPLVDPSARPDFRPPLEFAAGGFEDGAPDETLRVDSPEAPIPNASAEIEHVPDGPVDETLKTVIALADRATRQAQEAAAAGVIDGLPGSADGDGRGPLGDLNTDGGRAAARWSIRFREAPSIDEYARQLEFFGIELAALFSGRGELVFLSDLTSGAPRARVAATGDDPRLYMTWQGGDRRAADVALFERAGVDVAGAVLLHFYPPETEELLARLEQAFANRPADQIRRTYFVVVKQGNGYSFAVTRQRYNR